MITVRLTVPQAEAPMTAATQAPDAEPRCADCNHGTLAHNAIGGACTECDCGHFRPKTSSASGEVATGYEVTWPDESVYRNRDGQTRLSEAEAKATAPAIGGTWRRVTGQES